MAVLDKGLRQRRKRSRSRDKSPVVDLVFLRGPQSVNEIKDMVRRPLGWVQVRLELIDGTVDNIIIIIINVIVHD